MIPMHFIGISFSVSIMSSLAETAGWFHYDVDFFRSALHPQVWRRCHGFFQHVSTMTGEDSPPKQVSPRISDQGLQVKVPVSKRFNSEHPEHPEHFISILARFLEASISYISCRLTTLTFHSARKNIGGWKGSCRLAEGDHFFLQWQWGKFLHFWTMLGVFQCRRFHRHQCISTCQFPASRMLQRQHGRMQAHTLT